MSSQTWRLHGTILSPTVEALERYSITLLTTEHPDTILTFRFAETSRVLTFHKSYLTAASAPLRALITSPFLESTSNSITLHYETFDTFRVIRDFLYHLPIDMSTVPNDLPLVADRWGLDTLFRAYLHFVQNHHWKSFDQFMHICLPLLHIPHLPNRLKNLVIHTFTNDFEYLRKWSIHPFRQSVLWHALYHQRLVIPFVKYLTTNNNNCITFISHALRNVLNRFLSRKQLVCIISTALSTIPPNLSTTTNCNYHHTSPKVFCLADKLCITRIYLPHAHLFCQRCMAFFPIHRLHNRCIPFRTLLKNANLANASFVVKSIARSDYGD